MQEKENSESRTGCPVMKIYRLFAVGQGKAKKLFDAIPTGETPESLSREVQDMTAQEIDRLRIAYNKRPEHKRKFGTVHTEQFRRVIAHVIQKSKF